MKVTGDGGGVIQNVGITGAGVGILALDLNRAVAIWVHAALLGSWTADNILAQDILVESIQPYLGRPGLGVELALGAQASFDGLTVRDTQGVGIIAVGAEPSSPSAI